jgi:L-iditol 2-dehydrogenase
VLGRGSRDQLRGRACAQEGPHLRDRHDRKDRIEFTWDAAIFKGIDVFFNISTSYTSWDRAISVIEKGKVDAEALVTHREPLENWEAVFDALEAQQGIKALLIPE